MENDEEIPDTNGTLQAEIQEIYAERKFIVANVIRDLNAAYAANENPNVARLPNTSMLLTQSQDEIQTPQQMAQPRLPDVTREEAEDIQERVRGIRQHYMVRYRACQRQEIEEQARRVGESAETRKASEILTLIGKVHYTVPPFFPHPELKKWIPIYARTQTKLFKKRDD